jgi:UDP-N-acetylmuramate dehydrogenase
VYPLHQNGPNGATRRGQRALVLYADGSAMTDRAGAGVTPQPRLSDWTTLGVGGPADAFVEVADVASLADALAEAEGHDSRVLVLGGGSNIVVADEGFRGTVVHIAMKGFRLETRGDVVLAHVAAGEDWGSFVSRCIAEGLAGIECLSGIPGLAGATPVQNVGAYGQEVSDTIASVSVWDRRDRLTLEMAPDNCNFGYRTSIFRATSRYVVTNVTFSLQRAQLSMPLRYKELAERLGTKLGSRAGLADTARAVIDLRTSKGMVLGTGGPDSRSAGSFFVNPVLGEVQMNELLKLAPDVPRFPAGPAGGASGADAGGAPTEASWKVPAAWLVERAGFARGYRKDGAAISSKHTLALTVCEGGSARELLALARELRDAVREAFGVCLVPEPVLVDAHL